MRAFTVESSDRQMLIICRRGSDWTYYFKGVYTSVSAISEFQIVILLAVLCYLSQSIKCYFGPFPQVRSQDTELK